MQRNTLNVAENVGFPELMTPRPSGSARSRVSQQQVAFQKKVDKVLQQHAVIEVDVNGVQQVVSISPAGEKALAKLYAEPS